MPEDSDSAPRDHRRWRVFMVAFMAVVLLAAGGWWFILRTHSRPNPIPADIRQQVDFPLFYPSRLQTGYSVSQAPSVSESVVAMAVSTPSGNTIYISQQAAPNGLDYQKFLSEQLKRPREFSTPAGVGYIGGPVGQVLGSVLTSKVWILANASFSGNTEAEMKQLMASLTLAK